MASVSATSTRPAGLVRAQWSGMARTGQVVSSFAAVVVAYTLYWLIAVPLIEPGLEQKPVARVADEQVDAARKGASVRQRDVAKYFPPDSWELKNPAIWESEQARLLFKNLRPLPDGTVELKPCTFLFFTKSPDADPAAEKLPIIMRAVEGAIVRFDQPIVIKSVDLSKRQLVGGRLVGPITIHRAPSSPGAHDDLEITTRDVEMLKERIWTPHPVQFRLGRNRGSGREMEIFLNSSDEAPSAGGLRAATMRMLQLNREVKMQVELAGSPLAGGVAAAREPRDELPLEITCQGPFQFEMQKYAASFTKEVNVVWPSATGEADQMNSEVLTVLFDPRAPKPAAAPDTTAQRDSQLSSLAVRMIQARGNPVTIRSPKRGIYARCRGIDYTPAPGGAAGSFVAMGPGIMQRNLPSDPSGKYDAAWAREFRFEPDGAQHVATLRGAVTVRFAQMGKITSDEILAWLTPKNAPPDRAAPPPPPGAAPRGDGWQLERVLARVYQERATPGQGSVVIDSPQLHGTTDRLEAVVDRSAAPTDAGASAGASAAGDTTSRPARQPAAQQQSSAQRFDVRGRGIQVRLVPDGEQLAVSAVAVENQARLEEVTPARPGEKPLVVHGDRLQVTAANTEATRVAVTGRPGVLEAAGFTLAGGKIEMERSTHRLWIDGPGRMTMPIDQDLNGQPLARPQSMAVTWQGGMSFQSNTVVFKKSVEAQSENQSLNTETLEAILSRPIDFSNARRPATDTPADRPQLAHIRCYGPALLKSREFDERGEQTSLDLVRASDLAIDRASGDIHARGPGSVRHVSRGSSALEARTGAAEQLPPTRRDRSGNELTYLNVVFQRSIVGNLHQRVVTFEDSTKTVYGPVEHWEATLNADDPASLGPQGMVLDARKLTVREMAARSREKRGWFELEAQGNVVGEGSGFTARGERLTYSEEKNQIVLRGDGLSPAEFFQEDAAGGTRRESTANELTYWVGLQRVLVTGFKSFGVDVPSNASKKPAGK